MKNEMQIFKNDSFGKLTTLEKDNEIWFVAKEIADFLEYNQTSDMTRRLDADESYKIASGILTGTKSMARESTIINESGFYNAVIGSKKPEAKAFKKWVTSEVLPSIRKTGRYMVPQDYSSALRALADKNDKLIEAKKQIKQDKPKVEFADQVVAEETSMRIGEFAKHLSKAVGMKIGANKLMKYLRNETYLMQGRDSYEKNKPYQRWVNAGYFESKMEKTNRYISVNVTYITGKGQFELKDEILAYFM